MQVFEEAISTHEGQVDGLIKQCTQLMGALKAWKKACSEGAINDRQKHSDKALMLSEQVGPAVKEVASNWEFDVKAYLSSDDWQTELTEYASKQPSSLRIFQESGELVCSPVVLKSEPSRLAIRIGKTNWSKLRIRKVVAELVRLRDQGSKQNVQEFLDALLTAVEYLNRNKDSLNVIEYAKLRDVYDLFCLTPGWKKENSVASVAQQLYVLHKSGLNVTRSGKMFRFEAPTGSPKSRDIFEVVDEDGKLIRYYGIQFY